MARDHEKLILPHGNRIINDGFEVIGKPDGIGAQFVNMDKAQLLREHLAENGLDVTYVHMLIKATALATLRVPECRRFLQGYKLYQPRSVDVGVSVAARGNFAPVAVVKAAEKKSLAEIAEALRTESKIKRDGEDEEIRKLGWAYRILPTRWLRMVIIRFLMNLFPVVRQKFGSIQVSTLPMDFFWPLRIATSTCIAMGKVTRRPMVVDGEVKAPLTAMITLGMNHRVLDGMKVANLLIEIRKLLENPVELTEEKT